LVDLITRKVIDLIEGRDVETVSNWLKKFPNLKIISRDGSNTYRSAIEKANENIIQVSDRFHIVKALSEYSVKYIEKNYSKEILVVQSENITIIEKDNFEEKYNQLSPKAKENYDKKNKEFKEIKEYYNRYNNYSKVAEKFAVDKRTVKAYTHMDKLPIAKRKSYSSLDKYKDIVIDNIDKKEHDIYEVLKKKGYKGTYSNLRAYIRNKHLKVSTTDKSKYVSRTNIIELLNHRSISDLKLKKDDEKLLKLLLKQDKNLAKIIELNDNFSIALFSEDVSKLDKWIIDAKKLNISELNTFIETIQKDVEATKNAITYQKISNGIVEGKNCKLKMIKRMMYGRCSYELLRAKIIQLG